MFKCVDSQNLLLMFDKLNEANNRMPEVFAMLQENAEVENENLFYSLSLKTNSVFLLNNLEFWLKTFKSILFQGRMLK